MPERKLNPPPWENNPRKWNNSTESQKRYGYEQWMLARVRRGLDLDHPFPGDDTTSTDQGIDEVDSPIEGKHG